MKFKALTFLLFLLIGFHKHSVACSSIPNSFCDRITSTNHDVALVTFIEQNQHSSKAIVIEVLKGSIIKDTIDVYDYVFFCMEYDTNNLNTYRQNIGDTLLMILPKIDTVLNPWDTIGNYRFETYYSEENHLYFNNDTLKGFAAGWAFAPSSFNGNKIMYEDFKQVWLDTSKNCDDMRDYRIVNVEQKELAKQINIFPNPSENFLQIEIPEHALTAHYKLILYDLTGKIILQETISEKTKVINVENLVSGFYIMHLESKSKIILNSKLIKK